MPKEIPHLLKPHPSKMSWLPLELRMDVVMKDEWQAQRFFQTCSCHFSSVGGAILDGTPNSVPLFPHPTLQKCSHMFLDGGEEYPGLRIGEGKPYRYHQTYPHRPRAPDW